MTRKQKETQLFLIESMMKRIQPLAILLCGVGVSTISVYTIYSFSVQNAATKTSTAPAPVTAIVALGRIEPDGQVIKLSVLNAQDSRVNQILVKEGDYVKANQVIAILQGIEKRQADLKDALAQVQLQQAQLTKVQQGDSKKAQLVAQRAAIARLEAQKLAETKQKKAAIASAQATLREAQLNFKRHQQLAKAGAISRADADVAQRNFGTAQATLLERKADLEQTITTLQAAIAQQWAQLKELKEVRPVDVKIALAQLERTKIAVEQEKAALEDAKVRVPIAGQILKINTRVGEQVNTTEGIVELGQTSRMYGIAEVAETDISKVRLGQRASMTSEYGGFTGEVKGTVEQIGLQVNRQTLQNVDSNNPTNDKNARSVTVKIRIDPEDNPKVAALTYMQVLVKVDLAKSVNEK
ncbi:MAG: efflux RND transporter periplasmic adaptor subunit [Nostoc sp.]|uniref:HlyD family efflux transporter periplasmic adaptor subunit n=1 Tax=Nostoc sp. TaxID=1180 RepID=UPI002FF97393